MSPHPSPTEPHWTDGAWPVVGIWALLAAITFIIWWMLSHIMVRDLWILICASLAGTGTLVPIFGGLVYFSAKRRSRTVAARGALMASVVIFVVAIAASAYAFWLFSDALKSMR